MYDADLGGEKKQQERFRGEWTRSGDGKRRVIKEREGVRGRKRYQQIDQEGGYKSSCLGPDQRG